MKDVLIYPCKNPSMPLATLSLTQLLEGVSFFVVVWQYDTMVLHSTTSHNSRAGHHPAYAIVTISQPIWLLCDIDRIYSWNPVVVASAEESNRAGSRRYAGNVCHFEFFSSVTSHMRINNGRKLNTFVLPVPGPQRNEVFCSLGSSNGFLGQFVFRIAEPLLPPATVLLYFFSRWAIPKNSECHDRVSYKKTRLRRGT